MTSARILLDGTGAHDHSNGMSRYTKSLVQALPGCAREMRFTVILNPGISDTEWIPDEVDIFPHRIEHVGLRREVSYRRLAPLINSDYDLFHCLTERFPPKIKQGVCTIHDLRWLSRDAQVRGRKFAGFYYRWQLRRAARDAIGLIAISDWTRRGMFARWQPRSPISVVHHGASSFSGEYLPRENRIPGFLSVGEVKGHKNLPMLAKCARNAAELMGPLGYVAHVGKICDSALADRMLRESGGAVELRGYLPDEQLAKMYSEALGLLFLSQEEGFGFPALEAMQRGTPVICVQNTAVSEIVGTAGYQVDGSSPSEVAEAMCRLAEDREEWNRLSRASKVRAAQFSWRRAGRQTSALYRASIERSSGGRQS